MQKKAGSARHTKRFGAYLGMAFAQQLVDDDQALVARDLSNVERPLEQIREDLLGALFGPRRQNDVCKHTQADWLVTVTEGNACSMRNPPGMQQYSVEEHPRSARGDRCE